MTKPRKTGPIEAAAREILKILRIAGPMIRVRRSYFLRELALDGATYSAALDHIQARGRTKIMRAGAQDGFVALA